MTMLDHSQWYERVITRLEDERDEHQARIRELEVQVAELQSELLHTQVTLDEVIAERYPNQLSLR